ncbi:MAG: hypothetical protein WB661_12125 [Candidatus Bathyarchaeia archaeon]
MGRRIFATSVILFFVAPPAFTIWLVWGFLDRSFTVIVPLMVLLLYVGLLLSPVDYGTRAIRSVEIPNAPAEVAKLLKKTTEDGDLIHVILLRSFHNSEPLSQTAMTTYAQKRGVDLTPQQIRMYIVKMEDFGFIKSPEGRFKTEAKEYRLTDAGKWCRNCFPERTFMYYLRNGLGLLRTKQYPGTVPAQPAKESAPSSQGAATETPNSSLGNRQS